MKLLLVEDEAKLSGSIANYLERENFLCEKAGSVKEAEDMLSQYEYDCIILDITLPDGNGLSILESIRRQNKMEGVIIISAKNSLDDRLSGLDLGADDYLTKPFHLAELRSRIAAIIRRKSFNGSNQIALNELLVDLKAKTISVKDHPVDVTRKEFDLLTFLAANRNRVVSKRAIAEHITGDQSNMAGNFDFIYTHIKNLKRKLTDAGCGDYIKTIHGLGYKLEV